MGSQRSSACHVAFRVATRDCPAFCCTKRNKGSCALTGTKLQPSLKHTGRLPIWHACSHLRNKDCDGAHKDDPLHNLVVRPACILTLPLAAASALLVSQLQESATSIGIADFALQIQSWAFRPQGHLLVAAGFCNTCSHAHWQPQLAPAAA